MRDPERFVGARPFHAAHLFAARPVEIRRHPDRGGGTEVAYDLTLGELGNIGAFMAMRGGEARATSVRRLMTDDPGAEPHGSIVTRWGLGFETVKQFTKALEDAGITIEETSRLEEVEEL